MKFLGTYKAQDRYKLYYLNRAYKDKFINGKLLNCGEMYPIGNTPFAFSALDNKIIKEFQEIVLNFIIDDAKEMALHPNKKIRDKENCMSYLYTEQELKRFIKSYTQNNGDIDELHIGIVKRDNCFLCYEVGLKAVREKYKSYFLT